DAALDAALLPQAEVADLFGHGHDMGERQARVVQPRQADLADGVARERPRDVTVRARLLRQPQTSIGERVARSHGARQGDDHARHRVALAELWRRADRLAL